MNSKIKTVSTAEIKITLEAVDRLIEVGRLLFSVLTPEEIEKLQELLSTQKQTGNTGDS